MITDIKKMKINWTMILKVCGGVTTTFAAVTILFGVFRFIEATKHSNSAQMQMIQSQDSIKKIVVRIYSDVQVIKEEFVVFRGDVVNEINNHQKSYKEFLSRYANLNTEQYMVLTDGIRGLKEDLKKNTYRTPLMQE